MELTDEEILKDVLAEKERLGLTKDPSLQGGEPEKPICFNEKIILPAFPVDCLPSNIRSFVEDVSICRQVPVDLPAMLVLPVIATATQKKYRVYIGNTHDEPLNLWTVTAMEPGSRKTDSFSEAIRPLERVQSKLFQEAKPEIDRLQSERKIKEKRSEHLYGALAKKGKDQAIEKELQQLQHELSFSVPTFPRVFIGGDTTPEQLARLLHEQEEKISVFDSEGGIFSIMNGRYDGKGDSNLDVFLKGHAGDYLSVERKNSTPIQVFNPALTIALTVQPGVIKDLAGKKDFRNRGLLGRFLYSIPESLAGKRLYNNRKPNKELRILYGQALEKIYSQPKPEPEDEFDMNPHHKIFVQDEALECWTDFYNEIEKRQGEGGDLANMKDWASKLASAVARIAGNFHVIENGGNPSIKAISLQNIERACKIGRYHLIDHAKGAFGLMRLGDDNSLAKHILKWVSTKGKTTFTATDYWSGNRTDKIQRLDDLLPGFEILEDRKILKDITESSYTGIGNKPKHKYEVNAACRKCFRCLKNE